MIIIIGYIVHEYELVETVNDVFLFNKLNIFCKFSGSCSTAEIIRNIVIDISVAA